MFLHLLPSISLSRMMEWLYHIFGRKWKDFWGIEGYLVFGIEIRANADWVDEAELLNLKLLLNRRYVGKLNDPLGHPRDSPQMFVRRKLAARRHAATRICVGSSLCASQFPLNKGFPLPIPLTIPLPKGGRGVVRGLLLREPMVTWRDKTTPLHKNLSWGISNNRLCPIVKLITYLPSLRNICWQKTENSLTFWLTHLTTSAKADTNLIRVSAIPITRFVMVKSGKRVHEYSKETREYWELRNFVKALSKVYSDKIARLYRKQKGKCEFCGELPTFLYNQSGSPP